MHIYNKQRNKYLYILPIYAKQEHIIYVNVAPLISLFCTSRLPRLYRVSIATLYGLHGSFIRAQFPTALERSNALPVSRMRGGAHLQIPRSQVCAPTALATKHT